jgi:hypothetical protein
MFLALYKGLELERIDKYIFIFHAFAWGYSFIGAILPLFFKQYHLFLLSESLLDFVDMGSCFLEIH